MKALSIRAPWWWFILHGGKNIENRDWPTKFRGTIYIHASKWWQNTKGNSAISEALDCCGPRRSEISKILRYDALKAGSGCLVGTVDIVDCVSRNPDGGRWFFGDYGFVLENAVALERPIPFKGSLGFFEVPDCIEVSS
jgi:hypothetical protein